MWFSLEENSIVSKIRMYRVKHRFYKEKLKFYIENEVLCILCTEKTVCIIKKHGCYNERQKFYIETRFSIEENSIMYRKSVCIVKKTPFLQ